MRIDVLAFILIGGFLAGCSSPAEQRQAAYRKADAAIAELKTESGRTKFYNYCMKENSEKPLMVFFEGIPMEKATAEYCRRMVIIFADGYLTREQIADALDPNVTDNQSNAEIIAAMHQLDPLQ